MSKASHLEKEFQNRAVDRYGVTLYDAKHAIELINEANKRRIKILGIDSFRIEKEKIQPLLEHSTDYSTREHFLDEYWSEASSFINNRKDMGFLFEIVLGDAIEFAK